MKIESPAFQNGRSIPPKYTCTGNDISPPLIFYDVPIDSKSLAIIMDDPDAPSGTFDHWIVWNISSSTTSLPEEFISSNQGENGFKEDNYRGPCPPPGKLHRYFFKLYALDISINLPKGSTKKELENAMQGHILARAELIGTFQR